MAKELNKKPSFFQRLKTRFRFVILNDETFKEVSSYRINILNVYLLLSSLFLIIGAIVFLLIIFTPLKYAIPKYGDLTINSEFVELTKKTDELEKNLFEINNYIEGNKNRLFGNDIIRQPIESAYTPNEVNLHTKVKSDNNFVKNQNSLLDKYIFTPPVTGIISSNYDLDSHLGIDILVKKKAAVVSIADGYVIASDYNFDTGNTIGIQHSNNMVSFYKHNSKLLKKLGEFVMAGEAIAIAGNSGELSTGPHLHFELWMDGNAVNPQNFIDF